MSHVEHPLEHAEHAQHAAHDPLDRQVAMTMTIIAALLAAAAMISHRGHTETLRLTTEANICHTKASTFHTKASDAWNYYQAKNTLARQYQVLLLETREPKAKEYLEKEVRKYEGAAGKEGKLAELKREAEKLQKEGEEWEQKAEAHEHTSHEVHISVNWVDYGHLGLELALVLCSVTVLTKQRGFWYLGIAAAAAGLLLVLGGVAGLLAHGHL